MTKHSLLRSIITSALLLSPVAAPAQTASAAIASVANNAAATATTASGENARAAPAAAEEKKVCKQLPSSYSRMTKRACLTEKEWKRVEQDSQD